LRPLDHSKGLFLERSPATWGNRVWKCNSVQPQEPIKSTAASFIPASKVASRILFSRAICVR